jgi:hypothetical protein
VLFPEKHTRELPGALSAHIRLENDRSGWWSLIMYIGSQVGQIDWIESFTDRQLAWSGSGERMLFDRCIE